MFTAIQDYTRAEYGNSAISDVTSDTPYGLDEMESFWLAETLKYFYLLFSDPSLVSLDDWILSVMSMTMRIHKMLTMIQKYRSTSFQETKVDDHMIPP